MNASSQGDRKAIGQKNRTKTAKGVASIMLLKWRSKRKPGAFFKKNARHLVRIRSWVDPHKTFASQKSQINQLNDILDKVTSI